MFSSGGIQLLLVILYLRTAEYTIVEQGCDNYCHDTSQINLDYISFLCSVFQALLLENVMWKRTVLKIIKPVKMLKHLELGLKLHESLN